MDQNLLGGTEVDDIGAIAAGVVGEETILRGARHVNNVVVLRSTAILFSRLSHHDRSVHVNRVGRILDGTLDA